MQIGSTFGVRDGALRLGYEIQRGSGWMSRRMRAVEGWDRWNLARIARGVSAQALLHNRREGSSPFFFADARTLGPRLKKIIGAEGEPSIVAMAESILHGNLPYFGRLSFACGFPPNWFRNPATGESVAPDRSWTTMRFASPDYGDLKFILEPSRFLFVYALARAYGVSGDERFPAAFWRAIEDWSHHNPPMSGPLWICGQESSLRILAWSFALYAFLNSPETTPERASHLTSMVAAHAWRAQQTIGYARSQRSNHLISEAVGLWTVATLFPELKDAATWRNLGSHLLEEAVLDQITPEGAHLQYSFNYHRMVLQLLLWALRLSPIRGEELPTAVTDRTGAALEFLRAVVDPISGQAPNYGSNDGTLILPLSTCDYGDFRPVLQLGAAVLGRSSAIGEGPWDESPLWLCGESTTVTTTIESLTPPLAGPGFHRLGTRDSWALVRAGRYERRPFQADQLHVDIWHKGLNLARDAGTYLYNGDPPWDNALARTAVHNTITIDSRDQMRRAGRFLWLDWAQATGRSFSTTDVDYPDCFEGGHTGYRSLGVTHRRTVRHLSSAGWIIVDDLLGAGEHDTRLHWLVPDWELEDFAETPFRAIFKHAQMRFAWDIFASAPGNGALIRAGKSLVPNVSLDAAILGWNSPTYGELCPAISVVYRARTKFPLRLITVVRAGEDLRIDSGSQHVAICRGDSEVYRVSLQPQLESRVADDY